MAPLKLGPLETGPAETGPVPMGRAETGRAETGRAPIGLTQGGRQCVLFQRPEFPRQVDFGRSTERPARAETRLAEPRGATRDARGQSWDIMRMDFTSALDSDGDLAAPRFEQATRDGSVLRREGGSRAVGGGGAARRRCRPCRRDYRCQAAER